MLRTPLALFGLNAAIVADPLGADPVPAGVPIVAIEDAVAIAAPARVADAPFSLVTALPEAVASDEAPDLVADALCSEPEPPTTPPDPCEIALEDAAA